MKKITDKERLDWMDADNGYSLYPQDTNWQLVVGDKCRNHKSLRGAIDAAIRAERKNRRGK